MLNLWNPQPEVKPLNLEGMTLDQVRLIMLKVLAEESANHHRLGELYNYVVENKLAEGAGYKNAPDYFAKNIHQVSPAALFMYGAVARSFSSSVCAQFGVTRLQLLLIYKEAADIQVNHDEPGGTFIEVPDKEGNVTPKLFSSCSVEEMRKAIQRKRKPASSKPLPEADVELANQYRTAVTGCFPKEAVVRVMLRNQGGKPVLDFKGIPLGEVSKLIEGLMAQALLVHSK